MAKSGLNFDARRLMEQAVEVMRQSRSEPRMDGKATPKVGAVLWHPDGTTQTAHRGELREGDHAEFTILERKNRDRGLEGCKLFATLEPCAPGSRGPHKTPCAERIVLARIKEVWVGIEDPDPTVDRKGIKYLQDSGVTVHMFDRDLQESIQDENRDFLAQAEARALAAEDEPAKPIELSGMEHPVSQLSSSDLSTMALERFRAAIGSSARVSSPEFFTDLMRRGFVSREGERFLPTGFGMLLFGKEPRAAMPQAGLLATIEYPGGQKETKDFDGPLVSIPGEVEQWLKDKLPNVIDRSSMERRSVPPLPFEMVREAVVNALKAFRDTWRDGINSYLTYVRDRLVVARDLLTNSGSLYVQISNENVHRLRCVLDEVFGDGNAVATIAFRKAAPETTTIKNSFNYILWYARDAEHVKVRKLFRERELSDGTTEDPKKLALWAVLSSGEERPLTTDEKREEVELPAGTRVFRADKVRDAGAMKGRVFAFDFRREELMPGDGHCWRGNVTQMTRLKLADRLLRTKETLAYKYFIEDNWGVERTNYWEDTAGKIPDMRYVVETNEKIVARCVLMCTDPGDLVLDPTCGSGTTATVAEQWGRRWITIDTSRVALALARARIMGARYPYYLKADSREGQLKEAEVTRTTPSTTPHRLHPRSHAAARRQGRDCQARARSRVPPHPRGPTARRGRRHRHCGGGGGDCPNCQWADKNCQWRPAWEEFVGKLRFFARQVPEHGAYFARHVSTEFSCHCMNKESVCVLRPAHVSCRSLHWPTSCQGRFGCVRAWRSHWGFWLEHILGLRTSSPSNGWTLAFPRMGPGRAAYSWMWSK